MSNSKKIFLVCTAALLLAGCSIFKAEDGKISSTQNLESKVDEFLDSMTIEEKVAQLFIVLPEALTGSEDSVTEADDTIRDAIEAIPVGGLIYLSGSLQSEDQVKAMLSKTQSFSKKRLGLPAFL